jgi:pentapeptide repeat protein
VARDVFPPVWLREQCAVCWQRTAATAQRVWRTAAPVFSRGLQVVKDASRTTVARLRTLPSRPWKARYWKVIVSWRRVLGIVAVILLAIFLLMIIIIKVPQWQVASWQGQPEIERKDLAKLENDARTTLVQALGGAFLLIGLYFTFRNLQLTQDRQITEHYTRAVEQLGSDKLAVRLGAIYALERIAKDSERDHWPIMEILTAYIRENAPWKQEDELSKISANMQAADIQAVLSAKIAPDIQAALTVLGRRTYGYREEGWLNLTKTNLRKADLAIANLKCVNLREAHLEGADLLEADLQAADLVRAHLERAYLAKTHLEKANLVDAHLEQAELKEAHFEGAYLGGVCLAGALLIETHLEGAKGLTAKQLSRALTLYRAHLDPPLLEQIKQECPERLELPRGLEFLYDNH